MVGLAFAVLVGVLAVLIAWALSSGGERPTVRRRLWGSPMLPACRWRGEWRGFALA